jgi:hypothetical protein
MLVFAATIGCAWYLTKLLWGEKIAKYSLFLLIPLWLLGSFMSLTDDSKGIFNVGVLLSVIFAVAYVAVNILAFIIGMMLPAPKPPPPRVFTEEEIARAQEFFLRCEEHYKSFTMQDEPEFDDIKLIAELINAKKLHCKDGTVLTSSILEKLLTFREVTDYCLQNNMNPKDKDDREAAEVLVDLTRDDDVEYDDSDDWDDYDEPSPRRSSSRSRETKEYGSYVIQYRRHGSWIDGPGSNDERTAESMFDRFISNDPRGSDRCRLVYKVNGRVQQVLSTN